MCIISTRHELFTSNKKKKKNELLKQGRNKLRNCGSIKDEAEFYTRIERLFRVKLFTYYYLFDSYLENFANNRG